MKSQVLTVNIFATCVAAVTLLLLLTLQNNKLREVSQYFATQIIGYLLVATMLVLQVLLLDHPNLPQLIFLMLLAR